MRTRRALLLTLSTATSAAIVANAAWASGQPSPDAAYVWAQPGTSLVAVTTVQPAAVPVAPSMLPTGGYVWAQLGGEQVGVSSMQPA